MSFNATTAFLLHRLARRVLGGEAAFQCHHGVPASCPLREGGHAIRFCFNATTAFLLLWSRRRWRRWGWRFNATTAFLLPNQSACERGDLPKFQCHHGVPASRTSRPRCGPEAQVSMPPRRSCFLYPVDPDRPKSEGFNATTAFLLPPMQLWSSGTTPGFQCHHGVPASRDGVAGFGMLLGVSMPPRRSCFLISTCSGATPAWVSMPPRRSCFFCKGEWVPVYEFVSMPPRRSCF